MNKRLPKTPLRRPATRKGPVRSSARALRTLQHQNLPRATWQAIDTAVWFYAQLREPRPERFDAWSSKDSLHDEALRLFLQQSPETDGGEGEAATETEDATFWVNTELLQRARKRAERDGARLSAWVSQALGWYTRTHIPPGVLQFRQSVARQAVRIATAAPGLRALRHSGAVKLGTVAMRSDGKTR